MDRRRFRRFVLIWAGTVIGVIALFPHVLHGLNQVLVCGFACGIVAGVIGLGALPAAIMLISFKLLDAMWRRLRHLKMSRLWIVAVVSWYLASLVFLLAVGNFWDGFSRANAPGPMNVPALLPFLVAFVVFLAFHADDAAASLTGADWVAWRVAAAAAVHALVLYLYPVAATILLMTGTNEIEPGLRIIVRLVSFGLPFNIAVWLLAADFAVFIAALAFILIAQKRRGARLISIGSA